MTPSERRSLIEKSVKYDAIVQPLRAFSAEADVLGEIKSVRCDVFLRVVKGAYRKEYAHNSSCSGACLAGCVRGSLLG